LKFLVNNAVKLRPAGLNSIGAGVIINPALIEYYCDQGHFTSSGTVHVPFKWQFDCKQIHWSNFEYVATFFKELCAD
jgi:hypothetical protein